MVNTNDWLEEQKKQQVLRDARTRGVRAFMWGLFVDVSATVALVLVTAFSAIEWTSAYWISLGLLLAKTVLQSIVTYVARRLFPPADVR